MSAEQEAYQNFDTERSRILRDLVELKDKSPKGSIDEPIRPFLTLINAQPDWVTTSTCSGRLVSYLPGTAADQNNPDQYEGLAPASATRASVNGKGGGSWLFVSHSTLTAEQLGNPVKTLFGNHQVVTSPSSFEFWRQNPTASVVHIVYQPPVLHLLAKSVAVAIPLLTAAIGAGFRNSGLTIGHRGRVILAIRASTGGLDVPIALLKSKPAGLCRPQSMLELLVGIDYLHELLVEGNRLMAKNEEKLQRLFSSLKTTLEQSSSKFTSHWETAEERRKRMKAEGLAAQAASVSNSAARPNLHQLADNEDQLLGLSLLASG
ncbi:hypothetical protein O181_062114 [Austropuccinia psidii MF-1]|uniref:tRNA wybutosine-synthesizing protein 3 n=1 Tax=Austropuccinia psidii MF-1 TaxID=1389203 RepID=A0A9Q3I190_9BASI|nr:hypothetical protein [Austropuccinia psidii MF-1]